MLFAILAVALVIAALISKRFCAGSSSARIYGSLLAADVLALGVTFCWSLHRLSQMSRINLWKIIGVGFYQGCFVYPVLFLGIYWLVVRFRRPQKAQSAGRRAFAFSTAITGIAVSLFAIGVYATKIEPNRIEVTHTEIVTPKWKADSPPLKIVQLSDLHIERIGCRERRTLRIVKALEPDLILLTGDYTNYWNRGEEEVRQFLEALHAKYGLYAIHGNWNGRLTELRVLQGTGVRVLDDRAMAVRTKSGRLVLAGIPCFGGGHPRSLLEDFDTSSSFVILMSHMSGEARDAPTSVDLVLSGHTHGGQVCLPHFGSLIIFSKEDRDRASGMSKFPNGVRVYVNRGIGMEWGGAPPIRFLCRPEISVFTIRGKK